MSNMSFYYNKIINCIIQKNIDSFYIIFYYKMKHPTFWFSNSGLQYNDIISKLCCCFYKPVPLTEFEWDISEGLMLSVENVQK